MLVGTIAGIDDGNGCDLRGIACRAFQVVAHDDDVGIVRYHHNGILQRFALGTARDFRVGKTDNACSQAVGSRFETQAGACAGFKEERGDDTTL